MVGVRTCGYNGCGNPVREGETRCYLHVNKVAHEKDPSRSISIETTALIRENYESLKALSILVSRKAPGSLSMNEQQAEFLVMSSPLDTKTARQVADASEIINGRRPHLNVPNFVAQNLASLVDEMKIDLVESGIDPRRINKLQMWDATRRIGNGRVENNKEVGHLILTIDRDLPTESTVDVGISMFAPVADPNRSVADQFDTKYSPYGYAPLISSVETYRQEQYIWFKNFRYLED